MLARLRWYCCKFLKHNFYLKFIFQNSSISYSKLLECCGNLCDACALAAKFALSKAKFPKLIARSDDEGQIEIDVADDPLAVQTVNVNNVPYSISVNKIGHNYIVDADLKEEAVTKVRIIFGIDKNGHIRYSNKDGFGSLDPDTLYAMIDVRFFLFIFLRIYFDRRT